MRELETIFSAKFLDEIRYRNLNCLMFRIKYYVISAYFFVLIALFCSIMNPSLLSGKETYRIFTAEGSPATFNDMIKALTKADVIFFGELHGSPLIHWLQRETLMALHEARNGRIALGAEMLESDQQMIFDEYLGKKISERSFLHDARLWPSHRRDYQGLLRFARDKQIPVFATSPPRRYSALVFAGGLEALNDLNSTAKNFIAPLPVILPPVSGDENADDGFTREWRDIHMKGHWFKAQAIKDATMAHFIEKNLSPGGTFLHINGRFHSDFFRGIPWYLLRAGKSIRIASVSTVIQNDIGRLAEEHKGRGNFIICVPASFEGSD